MQETKDGKFCKNPKCCGEIQVPNELDTRPRGRKDARMCIQGLSNTVSRSPWLVSSVKKR